MATVVAHRLTPTVYSLPFVAPRPGRRRGGGRRADVHVKVDTGMHRVGADPADVAVVAAAVAADPRCASPPCGRTSPWPTRSDDGDRAFTAASSAPRRAPRPAGGGRSRPPLLHTANSAGAIAFPTSRLDMVRCGIALYGVSPTPVVDPVLAADPPVRGRPASRAVVAGGGDPRAAPRTPRDAPPTAAPAPGRRSTVATVPIGYADGVPRRYFSRGGTVLVGGRRRPLAGTVTMDQIVVDCGAEASCRWATRSCSSAGRGRGDHCRRTGPASSAPSATRCSSRSGTGAPGGRRQRPDGRRTRRSER